jgi:PTH1 family peptidyl-tRNA hydrolase
MQRLPGGYRRFPMLAAKPMAYMNRSGGPVSDIVQTYGIQCEDMVVIHDDIDLAYERLKIKEKGGDGGHNGLRSLIDALGTDDFVRVRMGVGRPEADIGVVEHVLGDFDALDQRKLNWNPFYHGPSRLLLKSFVKEQRKR